MKIKLLLVLCFLISLNTYSKPIYVIGNPVKGEKNIKQKIIVWCEVRGVYYKYVGENGVTNYVCSFVSQNSICYYVRCGEWNNVQTIQNDVPQGINIEEGVDFIAIPNSNGFQIVYLNGYNYNVANNTLTLTTN